MNSNITIGIDIGSLSQIIISPSFSISTKDGIGFFCIVLGQIKDAKIICGLKENVGTADINLITIIFGPCLHLLARKAGESDGGQTGKCIAPGHCP